jgi:hypothetical protein
MAIASVHSTISTNEMLSLAREIPKDGLQSDLIARASPNVSDRGLSEVDLRMSQPTDLTCPSTSNATVVRRARKLEFLTLAWNLVEAAVAIGSGAVADSAALIAFGIDSLIESSSSVVLLWRLCGGDRGEARERQALRLVGLSFLALAAYVAVDATRTLIAKTPPDMSLAGIVLAILSLVVMPLLSARKRRLAALLRSNALHADSRQSCLCATLSGILLGGLSLNAIWGWWWADPVAGLMMTPIIIKEGLKALSGEVCDCQRLLRFCGPDLAELSFATSANSHPTSASSQLKYLLQETRLQVFCASIQTSSVTK